MSGCTRTRQLIELAPFRSSEAAYRSLGSRTEIGLNPPGEIDVPSCDLFGTSDSGCCAAICTQALVEPLRRVGSCAYGPRWRRSSSIHTSGGKSYLWR